MLFFCTCLGSNDVCTCLGSNDVAWIGGYESSGTDIWLDGTAVDVGQLQVEQLDHHTYLFLLCSYDWKLADWESHHVGRALCEM